jgi:hypothetical protein
MTVVLKQAKAGSHMDEAWNLLNLAFWLALTLPPSPRRGKSIGTLA